MATDKYHQQKVTKGSCLIVEKIKEMARQSDIEINKTEWDGGRLSVNREDFHTLKIYTDDKSIQKSFYDEELADFPYDSADTIQKVRNIVKQLKI
jgi:hypothetical protein